VAFVWTRTGQPSAAGDGGLDPRIARSRAVIVAAASEHFLRHGYVGASVDDIAAAARVSKRTVYNIFGGKEQLFREILADAFAVAGQFAADVGSTLANTDDVEAELKTIAVELAGSVLSRRVVRLRRLLIGEAERFPELAREYYQRAPDRVMAALADAMASLGKRGLLSVDDPRQASEHFAFLVLGAPLDRALFSPTDDDAFTSADEHGVRNSVDVFLRAYGPR
jgi:TetR/AcrR family transcriptional regulator, mexJK operon transcriptional repressor